MTWQYGRHDIASGRYRGIGIAKERATKQAKIEVISRVWSSCLKSRKEEERVHEEDSGRSRTGPHKRDVIGTNPKKQHRKEAHNIVNKQHMDMA